MTNCKGCPGEHEEVWDCGDCQATCPACGGEGVELGTLGRLNWKRCRDCGMEFHGQVTPTKPDPTVGQWVRELAVSNTSTEKDEQRIECIMRLSLGFGKCKVTGGMVYPDGRGQPIDIHALAGKLVEIVDKAHATA